MSNDKPLDLSFKTKQSERTDVSLLNTQKKMVRGQDKWINVRKNNFISQILKCLECSKSFNSLTELSAHMHETKHLQKTKYESCQLKIQLKRSNKKLQSTANSSIFHKSSINYKTSCNLLCLICSEHFTSEMSLIEHLQNNHIIRQICTSCGAYFETNYDYQSHMTYENHHQRQFRKSLQTPNKRTKAYSKHSTNKINSSLNRISHCMSGIVDGKNPVLALELLVKNETHTSTRSKSDANTSQENRKTSPLSLLTQMHSSVNSYVF